MSKEESITSIWPVSFNKCMNFVLETYVKLSRKHVVALFLYCLFHEYWKENNRFPSFSLTTFGGKCAFSIYSLYELFTSDYHETKQMDWIDFMCCKIKSWLLYWSWNKYASRINLVFEANLYIY